MGRLKKFLAVLVPAVVATGASGVVMDADATRSFETARASGTHEALTGFLLTHPDAVEAGLARETLMHGAGATDPTADEAALRLAISACVPAETACVP